MKTAIIGLPMVGKTSLFTILTGVAQEGRIGSTAVRTGVAKVPDPRVKALAELYQTVPHKHGSVDPARDFEDVETELILSDLVVLEKRLERVDKDRKKVRNPELDQEYELLARCREALESNTPLRNLTFEREDEKRIRGFQFLSQKPMLLVLNLGEEDAPRLHEVGSGIATDRWPERRIPE